MAKNSFLAEVSFNLLILSEAVVQRCFVENVFVEISQNSQENTCARVSLLKETLAQVFSCEFCEISTNTFFTEHLWATASVLCRMPNRTGFRFKTSDLITSTI